MAETNGETPVSENAESAELTFETWFEGAEEPVKVVIESHTAGLRNALSSERDQRKQLAKQLNEVRSKLEEGSAAADQLDSMAAALEATQQRADFYELVAGKVTNPKLAYLAAQDIGAIGKNGVVKLEMLKAEHPELFETSKRRPPANGGEGAGQNGNGQLDMNAFIRGAAGRF